MNSTVILPQRPARPSRSQRRAMNAAKQQTATVVVNTAPQTNQRRRRNRRRNNRRRNAVRSMMSEKQYFKMHLLAPDVYGPMRQPRSGGSDRTGLGFDQTEVNLIGTATASNVLGLQASSIFQTQSVINFGTVTGVNTGVGAGSAIAPAVQFPATVQVADANLVACSIMLYYTGNPLNVQGEVILGSTIPVSTGATYSSLYYFPGTLRFPVAELINKPVRVAMRKLSPIADEFVPTNTLNADCDMPFVFVTGLPTGGTVACLITRSWEYRSTTVSGSVIPYEKVGPSHSRDVAALTDAKADIAQMESTISSANPVDSGDTGFSARMGFGNAGNLAGGGVGVATLIASLLAQRHLQRAAQGRNGLPFDVEAGGNFWGPD